MKIERMENTLRNTYWGIIYNIISIVFPFIVRTFVIKIVGVEYIGISGLCLSILQILNLAESGFSSAIVFSMYKPIVDDDEELIRALLAYYRKVYKVVGFFVLFLGLSILPFLPFFIHETYDSYTQIYCIYLIYLANTVVGYLLFAYQQSIFFAMQRNDLISNIQSIFKVLNNLFQIILLLIFKNYIISIIVIPISSIGINIMVAYRRKKKYPQFYAEGEINQEIRKDIKKRVIGVFFIKLCGSTRNSLDSIFISYYLGLFEVAIYGNYYLILISLMGFLGIICSSMGAGIGNSMVLESKEKNFKDMQKFLFLFSFISAVVTACLLTLYQPFMLAWVGKELTFPFSIVILFCIYFYMLAIGNIRALYIVQAGLWWEERFRSLSEAIFNILLNWLLAKYFGVYGILVATIITLIFINNIYSGLILFKFYFHNYGRKKYFISFFSYILIAFIGCVISYNISYLFKDLIIYIKFIIYPFISFVVFTGLYYFLYHKTQVYKDSKSLFINIFQKILINK